MPRYVAFLRAVNVGGRTIKMEALRQAFETMGFDAVETFIASGNVVFTSTAKAASLETKIATHLEETFGYEVPAFVRTVAELAQIATHEPFGSDDVAASQALNIGFLKAPADPAVLAAFATEIDAFAAHGREVYWLCRVRQSDSKFNNAVLERRLKLQATWRGANTVRKMAAKYAS